ncbi:MAG: hypothetical protein ACJAZZ_000056 [Dokdonia donghaensis]|jgi:hypothetical protein
MSPLVLLVANSELSNSRFADPSSSVVVDNPLSSVSQAINPADAISSIPKFAS